MTRPGVAGAGGAAPPGAGAGGAARAPPPPTPPPPRSGPLGGGGGGGAGGGGRGGGRARGPPLSESGPVCELSRGGRFVVKTPVWGRLPRARGRLSRAPKRRPAWLHTG